MRRLAKRCALLLTAALPSTAALAHPPWAIAVDRSGQVYFSDLEAVWRVGPDGRVRLVRPAVSGRHVHEIRIDGAGNLIGEELRYDPGTQIYHAGIWRITPRGAQSWLLPPTSTPPKGRGIWTDARGNSFHVQWTDNEGRRLLAFRRDARGGVTRLLGAEADAARFAPSVLYNSGGFALGPEGTAYFTDRANLYVYRSGGRVSRLAGLCVTFTRGRCTKAAELRGVAIGVSGRIYVADSVGRRVLRRNLDGSWTNVMRSGAGWSPHGVTLSRDALYVLEFTDYHHDTQARLRIRKLDQAGKVTLLTTRPTA